MPEKTIYLASDHAGFDHKLTINNWLSGHGYSVVDCGAYTLDPEDDFPDFIAKAAEAVSQKPETSRAIIFGGSGQGEAMLANRYQNVRATVYYGGNIDIITLSREHNDANVLAIGARFLTKEDLLKVVEMWLTNPVKELEERHIRRIKKMEVITKKLKSS